MDLGIKELGITLMIGAFTILGADAILHYFLDWGFTGFFEDGLRARKRKEQAENAGGSKKKDENEQTMAIVVFIGFAFGVGIIAEDLSYRYVDSENLQVRSIPAKIFPASIVTRFDLPSEETDLVSTLVESLKKPNPSPLTRDLADNHAFQMVDKSTPVDSDGTAENPAALETRGEKIEKWILDGQKRCKPHEKTPGEEIKGCPSPKEIQGAFKDLYYYAKNTVYAQSEYYEELRRIQTRLEFTRSLAMLAFMYFAVVLAVGIVLLVWHMAKSSRNSESRDQVRQLRFRIPAMAAVMFGIYFMSIWAYTRETDAFNKRVFGYLSTTLVSKRLDANKPKTHDAAAGSQAGKDATTAEPPSQKRP
jgi:hypothetical protein